MASVEVDALIRFAHVAFAVLWFAVVWVHGRVMPKALSKVADGAKTFEVTAVFSSVILPFYWISSIMTILFGFVLFAQYDPRALSFPIHIAMGLGMLMLGLSIITAILMKNNLTDWKEGDGYDMKTHFRVVKLARVTFALASLAFLLMVFGAHSPATFPLPDVTDAVIGA